MPKSLSTNEPNSVRHWQMRLCEKCKKSNRYSRRNSLSERLLNRSARIFELSVRNPSNKRFRRTSRENLSIFALSSSFYNFPITDVDPTFELKSDFFKMRDFFHPEFFVKLYAGFIRQRNSCDDRVNFRFIKFFK